jgi:hypothetical protein
MWVALIACGVAASIWLSVTSLAVHLEGIKAVPGGGIEAKVETNGAPSASSGFRGS